MAKFNKEFHFYVTSYENRTLFDQRNHSNPIEDLVDYDKFLSEIAKVDYLMTYDDREAKEKEFELSTKPHRNFSLTYFFKESSVGAEDKYYDNSLICYNYPRKEVGVVIRKKITYNELKKLFDFVTNLGLNLLSMDDFLVTPQYLERLRYKEENAGPKLSDPQEKVLANVDLAASWIFVPNASEADILQFLEIETQTCELMSSLTKSFEGEYVGIVAHKGNIVLFGNNVESIKIKKKPAKAETKTDLDDLDIVKFIKVLSQQFGDAQFYCHNRYERKYIHYKHGLLHYLGMDGDDGPTVKYGTLESPIDLTTAKVKTLSEENGEDLETFLASCFQSKTTCQIFKQKSKALEFFKNLLKR